MHQAVFEGEMLRQQLTEARAEAVQAYSTVISIGGWEQFVHPRGADCVLAGGVV